MKKYLSFSCVVLLCVGCTPSTPSVDNTEPQAAQKIIVATSFYPQTHFAEQVGRELVDVVQVAAPGADPHTYEPTPQQIQQVYNSDLLIFNGLGQDPWADRLYEDLQNSDTNVLAVTELVDRMAYEEKHEDEEHGEHEDEEHGEHEDEDDHEHGEWDPHVWLDPQRAEKIVEAIASELSKISPTHTEQFRNNADAYVTELRTLDQDMQAGLSNCNLDAIIVSHDAYRYLANRYGFHTLEIAGLSPSVEPSPARLAELTELAEEENIHHVFFETHVSPALSQTLADEIGASTLVLHSIEALTEKERSAHKTYIDLMRQNLDNLRIALQCT